MRLVVELDAKYGDYSKTHYDVTVSEYGEMVRVAFDYHGDPAWPKGGFLVLPKSVADRIGGAMQVGASGPLKTPISFEVDETKIV